MKIGREARWLACAMLVIFLIGVFFRTGQHFGWQAGYRAGAKDMAAATQEMLARLAHEHFPELFQDLEAARGVFVTGAEEDKEASER